MLTLMINELWGHRRRLAGTGVAVVLGVAFLAGTLVMGDTVRAGFDHVAVDGNAGIDVAVRSTFALDVEADEADEPRPLVDLALVDRIRAVDGVAAAEGRIEGKGRLLGADGRPVGGGGRPQLVGSWTTDPALSPYRLVAGRPPVADDEVVVNRGAAEAGDLQVGDRTVVLTPDPVDVTVVGLATYGDADGLADFTFAGFGRAGAMAHVTGDPGGVTSIVVRAGDGVTPDALVERVGAVLPAGLEAVTGADLAREDVEDVDEVFLGGLTSSLTVFAGIALVVAAFSIQNTFAIVVAQRTHGAALLRALGASRRQIVASFVAEAVVVGVVASAAGVAGGIGVAWLLERLVEAVWFPLPGDGPVVSVGAVAVSLAVGTVVSLVAGIVPAVRASRVPPLAALRAVAVERTSVSRARRVAGVVVAVPGVVATAATGVSAEPSLAVAGLGAVATLVGAVVVGPVVVRPVAWMLGFPLRRVLGVTGVLAGQNTARNPRRTAATASALVLGVGMVTLFTVFAASLKDSAAAGVGESFRGDLVVTAGVFGEAVSPRLARDVDALPEVERAVGIGRGWVLAGAGTVPVPVTVGDPAELAVTTDLEVTAGSLTGLGNGAGAGGIAVADHIAAGRAWAPGDVVPVTFADGVVEQVTVAAVYAETDLLRSAIVPPGLYLPHARQAVDSMVVVDLAPGTSEAGGRAAIGRVAERYGSPAVQDRAGLADAFASAIDVLLAVVYALLALAIVIALLGIANTLSLAIHERTRELGLLRAVGQTRRQVWQMVEGESVLVATLGTLGGVVLGAFLGWALVKAAGSGADGGVTEVTLPLARLAVVVVVGLAAGLLAGLRPAHRAARLDVLTALAAD